MKLILLAVVSIAAILADESAVTDDFSLGYRQFTSDLYHELIKENTGNFVACPLSLDIVLSLVNDGAKGRTSKQLTTALHLPQDKEKIKQIFVELSRQLKGNDKVDLSSANKIYIKEGFEIRNEFRNTALDVYNAEVQNIEFTSPSALNEINGWIEEKTHKKIKDVLGNDDLTQNTAIVLINALYFHGQWKKKFDEKLTTPTPFHINKNSKVDVDMMEQTNTFKYYESPELNAKFLRMSYEGSDITMTIVLPNDVEGLPALESHLSDVLADQHYSSTKVHVQIPKFKIETKIELIPILKTLGVTDMFDENADLSGIMGGPGFLYITQVIQKALIEVEEKGTTAAAASVVVGGYRSSHAFLPPVDFIADHPFIYYLKSPSGVMFVGRYVHK